jgi:hypothetical protein
MLRFVYRHRESGATVLAALALIVALGSTDAYATVKTFMLGTGNTADRPTTVTAAMAPTWPTTGSQRLLQLTNSNTIAGATALGLNVAAGHAPFTVNSGAKVANLNADKLDGADSTGFYQTGSTVADSTLFDGQDYQRVINDARPKVSMSYSYRGVSSGFSRNFTSPGGYQLFTLNGSAYAQNSGGAFLALCVVLDGNVTNACAQIAVNEGLSHKALIPQPALLNVPLGFHTVTLTTGTTTLTNNDDFYSLSILGVNPN